MAVQEDEDLLVALRKNVQKESPEPKQAGGGRRVER